VTRRRSSRGTQKTEAAPDEVSALGRHWRARQDETGHSYVIVIRIDLKERFR
jgi:hypothetical protein